MKYSVLLMAGFLSLSLSGVAQNKPGAKPTPKPATPTAAKPAAPASAMSSALDSVSYAIGVNIGQSLKGQNLNELNISLFQKGLEDVMKGRPTTMDYNQSMAVIQKYFQQMQAKKYEAVKVAGQKFLADNKSKPGVVTLPSGMQYQILKAGDGAKPLPTDKVKVHYHGTTIDGQVFDSSVDRGEPISFQLNGLIPGWIEALQLMPTGSKWKLFIPYNLAYGETGSGPKIPPFSTLIFDVELLGIEK